MAVAERAEIGALWHLRHQRRDLVQRVRLDAEYDRALRSEELQVPELGASRRRQHRSQYIGHAGWQFRAGEQSGQCGDAGHDPEVKPDDRQPPPKLAARLNDTRGSTILATQPLRDLPAPQRIEVKVALDVHVGPGVL